MGADLQHRDFSYPDRGCVGIRDFQAKSGWFGTLCHHHHHHHHHSTTHVTKSAKSPTQYESELTDKAMLHCFPSFAIEWNCFPTIHHSLIIPAWDACSFTTQPLQRWHLKITQTNNTSMFPEEILFIVAEQNMRERARIYFIHK